MNLLTEHLAIWTGADNEKKSGRGRASGSAASVYGVKKLRELILELAVRGKLVPQDVSDEPASELLKRIAAEKAKLIKEGKIKAQKPLAEIAENEKPFELPKGWEWAKLGFIGYTQTGGTPKKSNAESFGSDIPFIKPSDIYLNQVEYNNEGLSFGGAEELGRIAHANSLLMVCIGTIGKCNLIDRSCSFNQQINSVTPYLFDSKYLLSVCRSIYFYSEAWSRSFSTTIPILNKGNWEDICIPIPSLAEQHRIVAKVDELMTLCDQLENQHSNAIVAHEKLVSYLLNTLTQTPVRPELVVLRQAQHERGDFNFPSVPVRPELVEGLYGSTSIVELVGSPRTDDFAESWQRISANFDTLFSTESSIDALKQTVLQLAVMGKLVPQDANDEPASELLKRIQAEKAKLVKEGKYQKTAKLKTKESTQLIPSSWEYVQVGHLCPSIVPNRDKPRTFTGNIPWITLPSFPKDDWYLDTKGSALGLSADEVETYAARVIPSNSVLMSCVGRFGLTAINTEPVVVNQQIHAFVVPSGLSLKFLSIVIRVNSQYFDEVATSTTIKYLNKTNCESMEFGLPPLAEQHRIVAKVDELMAICEQLKTRITTANQLQQKLADVLVSQAVA